MKLSVFTSFEPAQLEAELRRWNKLIPLFLSIEVHRPELLGWGMTGAGPPDQLRFLLLNHASLTAQFSAGTPAVFAPHVTPVPFLMLCPDEHGSPTSPINGRFEAVDASEYARAAGIREMLDAHSDRIANVPYTEPFYISLATTIFRRAWSRLTPPTKVIAVDCDGTLWRGLCAEDGPAGVQIGAQERALHHLLLRQKRAGRLLVLVSKNMPADVEAVFAQRADLELTLDDVVARRIGWDSKPLSLASLARELRLSLDSFVFIDDSPAECAEMRATLPQVTVVERPESDVRAALQAVWPLDITGGDGIGVARTEMYREEVRRSADRIAAPTFPEYLESLQLRCTLHPATDGDAARILELTQRVNQFATTALRPTLNDVRGAISEGGTYAVRASDRFGDYGLCGVVFVRTRSQALEVTGLLLSCRVLGRGVEETVIDSLIALARTRQSVMVNIAFEHSARNLPAQRFLDRAGGHRGVSEEGVDHYQFRVATFERCARQTEFDREVAELAEAATSRVARGVTVDWALVARHAASAPEHLELSTDPVVQPSGVRALEVLKVIGEVLGRPVTSDDNLYALGADSLRLVRIVARLRSRLALELPIGEVMQHRVIGDILLLAERQTPGEADDAAGSDFEGLIQSIYDDEPRG